MLHTSPVSLIINSFLLIIVNKERGVVWGVAARNGCGFKWAWRCTWNSFHKVGNYANQSQQKVCTYCTLSLLVCNNQPYIGCKPSDLTVGFETWMSLQVRGGDAPLSAQVKGAAAPPAPAVEPPLHLYNIILVRSIHNNIQRRLCITLTQ